LPPAGFPGETLRAMPDATIHTRGLILENPSPVLYRVSLPNGKIILAHLSKPLTTDQAVFAIGASVLLELTPYDFDTARILGGID
jgi:translation initiation factor IF-1